MKTSLQPERGMRIAITGGGTGGHVYPGIAVAKEVTRRAADASILFIGTQHGLESKIVPHEGFALLTIPMQGFMGKSAGHKLKTFCLLPYSVYRSFTSLRKFRPQVVFGTGGYVSVPVMYAAYLLHIPTVLLEPNRKPGTANRVLSKIVDRIAMCFEDTAGSFPSEKVVLTGNPIRKEFDLLGQTPPPDQGETLNILILGGSRGARRINDGMIDALDFLGEYRENLTFTHQTGPDDYASTKAGYEKKHFHAEVYDYIHDIPRMYARSHLLVCRAGANTVAELAASRRPAILIPYPHHGDKHQEYNARALEDAGMAHVILQHNLSGKTLSDAIMSFVNHPERVVQNWTPSLRSEIRSSAEKVVDLCLHLAHNKAAYVQHHDRMFL